MKSNFTQKVFVAAALALSGSVMFADTVSGTGATSGMWQNWSASQANGNGSNYWNNVSWDGPNMNVGNCLTSSNCGMNNVPGAISYLGQSNGQAFTNFYFDGSQTAVTATLEAQIAADKGYETLGWYNVLNPNQNGIIFSTTSTVGSTDTFTPSAEYGLFFVNAAGTGDIYTSQSSWSPSDTGRQHFAVFQQNAGNYYVGIEDLPSCNSDFDYNDMVVKMSSASAAPEPGALLLIAVGFTALGAFRFFGKAKATKA